LFFFWSCFAAVFLCIHFSLIGSVWHGVFLTRFFTPEALATRQDPVFFLAAARDSPSASLCALESTSVLLTLSCPLHASFYRFSRPGLMLSSSSCSIFDPTVCCVKLPLFTQLVRISSAAAAVRSLVLPLVSSFNAGNFVWSFCLLLTSVLLAAV
jgi:hypothetical protein